MLVLCVLWPPWSFFIVLGCQSALFDGIGAYLGNFWRRLASLAGILIVSMRPGIAIGGARVGSRLQRLRGNIVIHIGGVP